jgi:aryl-alcohol dehydrogenase-like predicted oxidoreductase
MKYVNLGKTDIKISAVGLGTWAFAGDSFWGNQDDKDSINTVLTALDSGVNFIDTAEGYGRSENVLGKALKGKRNKAVLATKAIWSNLKKENLLSAFEKSLERLNTDYIDLYYIHWPNVEAPLEGTIEIMEKLKKEGKIRSIGVSNFGLIYINQLIEIGKIDLIDVNQLPYSLLWRAIEFEIKDACLENNIDIVSYSSLAQGLLTGLYNNVSDVPDHLKVTRFYNCKHVNADHGEKGCEEEVFKTIKEIRKICEGLSISMPELAVAWLLHQNGVCSVLTGARKPDEIIQNVKAAEIKLDYENLQKITKATEEVKKKLGINPDMWVNEENSRYIKGFSGI